MTATLTSVRCIAVFAWLCAASMVLATQPACARWRPQNVVATRAALGHVLAAYAHAAGSENARLAQRRERWTYANLTHRIAVSVAVRDDDFRTALELDGLTYTAGRSSGARWRADGNGIVHGVQGDLQGDALDRAPQAIFRLDPATWTLVGETSDPAPAWVIETGPSGDKPAFLYIDKATGSIVREVMRDGKRVVTTSFDRFEALEGALRARHWHVDDGSVANALDVTVDAIEPGPVAIADVAFPVRRVFVTAAPLRTSFDLPASFHDGEIEVEVEVGIEGTAHRFLLDTGTASITVDPALARTYGGPTLEHAVLPRLAIGPLYLERVSTLTASYGDGGGGILGLDFFFGHVVEVDYLHGRVRILSVDDARDVFADPKTVVVEAGVDWGLPLVHAGFGPAQSELFALDTGSPHIYVTQPFAKRYAREMAASWTPAGRSYVQHYLEGGIEVKPYRVARFDFAHGEARNLIVGAQLPTTRTDDLAIPFEGIIGTDILRSFDLIFDYDNGRVGVRH